jgi:hypothetical protein
MKKLTLLILIGSNSGLYAQYQYSKYYIDQNINQNVNLSGQVNQNVNVTTNENKTIRTIDYGALALANATAEKNRLERLQYADARSEKISLEIAADPAKALEYGSDQVLKMKGDDAALSKLSSFDVQYKAPHESLFHNSGNGRFENISADGITTEIIMYAPNYNFYGDTVDIEKVAKLEYVVVGEVFPDTKNFIHKKDISRATVYGLRGFKSSIIWEDEYEFVITDNYVALDPTVKNGVAYLITVRTHANKTDATFEQLEGRRYYFRRLMDLMASTSMAGNFKFLPATTNKLRALKVGREFAGINVF